MYICFCLFRICIILTRLHMFLQDMSCCVITRILLVCRLLRAVECGARHRAAECHTRVQVVCDSHQCHSCQSVSVPVCPTAFCVFISLQTSWPQTCSFTILHSFYVQTRTHTDPDLNSNVHQVSLVKVSFTPGQYLTAQTRDAHGSSPTRTAADVRHWRPRVGRDVAAVFNWSVILFP